VDCSVDKLSTLEESRTEMKSFYSSAMEELRDQSLGTVTASDDRRTQYGSRARTDIRARIAVYNGPSATPRIVDVEPSSPDQFIETLSTRVYEFCRMEGGNIPYTVIREIAENFIHADFLEPVVSILESGSLIRFADQGPGFPDKERALAPGFTTARGDMKRYIRGVGSGLPIVQEYLAHSGGFLVIEDNLGSGSVVTVHAGKATATEVPSSHEPALAAADLADTLLPLGDRPESEIELSETHSGAPRLSMRQQQVLALVLEAGLAGPSLVSRELGVGISTAYRDLAMLEDAGLIESDAGKRALTPDGLSFLANLMNRS
jgi:DNA-binding MarR family transcriptional regulator